jgi:cytochrome c biogenesis protein CcmG, thiol:disulfide interchange protein DsbE
MRPVLAALICAGAVLAGCGSEPRSAAPSHAAQAKALAGSPAPLASLHSQAGKLLGGGTKAFTQRLDSLKGHPVVVNKWASWCGPCRAEFPVFQKVSVKLGKRIAFIGVDSSDNKGDAKGFLKRYPVSYPSYFDPDLKIAAAMKAVGAFPTTVYYSSQGKIVGTHYGGYAVERTLLDDIGRYAK